MSDLEKDFEETAAKINAKIKEAADALAEANRLADEAGLCGLIYTQWTRDNLEWDQKLRGEALDAKCEELEEKCGLIDVGPLEAEMANGGWSTSSSYC